MNRDQFFNKLAPLGEEELRKTLWNLYWRGSRAVRERIESELEPPEAKRRPRAPAAPPDPVTVLRQVEDFVELARSGAYLGGDRRVSPKRRTRWRFEFRQLVADTRDALRADGEGFVVAATAMDKLLDLACELRSLEHFRSDDPLEAAKIVVSDEVALLWRQVRDRLGFAAFAAHAAGQLLRWESPYGWTRHGYGSTAERETSLAVVLDGMLEAPDAWSTFAEQYLTALDRAGVGAGPAVAWTSLSDSSDWARRERARNLAGWHGLLLDRLDETDGVLDRLVSHPALGGPELTFLRAQLAHRRGQRERARELMAECLAELPGHMEFIRFALDVDAPLPPRSSEIADGQPGAAHLLVHDQLAR